MNNVGMYGLAGMERMAGRVGGMGRSVGGRAMGMGAGAMRGVRFAGRHPKMMIGGGLAAGGGLGYAAYRSSGRDGLRGRSSGGY